MKWKVLELSKGKYSISSTGLVKRNPTYSVDKYNRKLGVKERILKHWVTKKGYHSITLRIDNKSKNFSIHRLVGMCFLPMKLGCDEINHKDFIKSNNNVENLEWVNKRENMHHYFNVENPGVRITKSNKYNVRIMINGKRECLGTFENIEKANEQYRKRLSQV